MEATADRLLKWDSRIPGYLSAFKADGTGLADIDGKWFTGFDSLLPADLTVEPGEGFFIQNRQNEAQSVFLAGKVTLDAAHTLVLEPPLSLFGSPYLAGREPVTPEPSDRILDAHGEPGPLQTGKGYWYHRQSDETLVWTHVRPYADPFPPEGSLPDIEGLQGKPTQP